MINNIPGDEGEAQYFRQHATAYAVLLRYLILKNNGRLEFDKATVEKLMAEGGKKLKTREMGDKIVAWLE